MNHKPRAWGVAYGVISAALCTGIALAGCGLAIRNTQDPALPVPTKSAPVLAISAEEPEISSVDLWSDDRSCINTPLLNVPLEAGTQWAIFEQCGQKTELFCAVMSIAEAESGFDPQMVGDGGDSIGMMQINTRWHTGRMDALGVTDLTDPVQCAAVAIDYLQELESRYGFEPESEAILCAYNMGPAGARKAQEKGIYSTDYSKATMEICQRYLMEMESAQGAGITAQ